MTHLRLHRLCAVDARFVVEDWEGALGSRVRVVDTEK
jgi:hypothetical protein